MLGWPDPFHAALAFAAALVAGAVNAVAGGGTNVAFSALVWLGLPPISANATTSVALWPGRLGGAWGFRQELLKTRHWWFWLAVPSLLGGALGAYLLVHSPPQLFKALAPYLVLGSTALVAAEPVLTRWLHQGKEQHRSLGARAVAVGVQFVVAGYGGYFGAGLGFLLLTALGLLGVRDLARANGLKNLFGIAIKGAAVVYFVVAGAVAWHAALVMAVGALVGGYAGATLAHRLDARLMRGAIVLIGVAIAVAMFLGLR
ncbi:MAG TPA: sulfite exporter TauE/SafE family protein [Chloroflexota bacterium]|jgi:hypothetical protein